jgi:uracil-DNA glycosylase family 4
MPRQKPSDSLSNVCPVCGAVLVLPIGPPDARAIIVSDRPGEWELCYERPFVPQAPAGRVLHHELIRAGLSIDEFRVTNVWLHEPNEFCLDWHAEQCAQVTTRAKAVLLLGSIAARCYLGIAVMSISGIVLRRKDFSNQRALASAQVVVAGPNPAEALHGGIGELRLCLQRFAAAYKRR